jgi:preprotein translocase subunit SecB
MVTNGPGQDSVDEKMVAEEKVEQAQHTLPLVPSPVQLQNIFAIEIIAKRFPVIVPGDINAQINLNLEAWQVFQESSQAQVILNVQVGFENEPRPFEISFKLVGIFAYPPEYSVELVRQFLELGSLSILLPFARELLVSLCTRLQVPPVFMQMIQVIPPPANVTEKEDAPE